MSCELRYTTNPQIKLVLILGETVGEISRTRSGWLFHRRQPVWSNLPPRIALEVESFANEQCIILGVTARLKS